MPGLKVTDMVEREERPWDKSGMDWFQVDPDVVYPVALTMVQRMVAGEEPTPSYCTRHITDAKRLAPDAFELAAQPLTGCPMERRADRAGAIEAARLVFSALLREQNGGPIGVHIIRRDRWKL